MSERLCGGGGGDDCGGGRKKDRFTDGKNEGEKKLVLAKKTE